MLDAEVQGILGLIGGKRQGRSIEGERRRWIEPVAHGQIHVLSAGAVGEVSRREQADSVLKVACERLLPQIVDMVRGKTFECAAILVVRGIVVIDSGQKR